MMSGHACRPPLTYCPPELLEPLSSGAGPRPRADPPTACDIYMFGILLAKRLMEADTVEARQVHTGMLGE